MYTTLEQSIRLKEFGMPQETKFFHITQPSANYHAIEYGRVRDLYINDEQWVIHYEHSAYTADELMNLLPMNHIAVFQWAEYGEKGATCTYHKDEGDSNNMSKATYTYVGMNYAQAMAGMLLRLIEEGIIAKGASTDNSQSMLYLASLQKL